MKFLDNKKFRIIISLFLLLIVGIITTVVSFSNTYDWVETDVDKLYKKLLLQNDQLINSDKYLVTDGYVTRIEPNTTVEEFTANINRDDFVLTYNNVKVNNGLVKTGMVLTRGEEVYTLVVAGDLNQDGLMTTIDTSMMIDNIKVVPSDELVRKANDFNEDGKLDKVDVDNSVDYILNDNIELKENKSDVPLTSMEVISGDLGENNWYRDDIVVKISNNGAKDTAYKVIGTSIQEGVGISDGAEVTLSGYGAYKIIAWNYNEDGVRSGVTTLTFKIDDREIVPTVTYSTTEPTSKKVVATISFNKENVFVSNNNKNNDYTFYKNGKFEYEYLDVTGRTGKIKAEVSWMEDAVGADGEWRYSLVDEDEIYLREYLGEVNESTNLVVPAEYDGYKVYGVGNNTYDEYGIPLNILGYNLGNSSSYVNDIEIKNGLKEIGFVAFANFRIAGDSLEIPDSVESIGDSAFSGTEISGYLTLGNSLKEIGAGAFESTWFIGDLVIPDSVEKIDVFAFSSSNFGGRLILGKNLTYIGYSAFSNSNFNGSLTIPDKIEYIEENTFYNCDFEGELILGKSLKGIDSSAFYGNSFIGNLIIPDSLEYIYDFAFSGNLFDGTLTLGNKLEHIGYGAFSSNNFEGNLVISDSVTIIDPNAFMESGFTGNLVIGDGVTHIYEKTFMDTDFAGTLTLGNKVKEIKHDAFYGASFTGDLVIPDSVEKIDETAFGATGFDGTLTLGKNVKNIGVGAFVGVKFTGDLVIPDKVETISLEAFAEGNYNGTLTLGSSLKTIGSGAFKSNKFTGDLTIPDSVTLIEEGAFFESGFTGTLTLGENLEIVDVEAFFNCNFTGDLVIPDSVEIIGSTAFMYNGFGGTLTLGNSVTEIGSYAFADNRFTGGLSIPDSVEYVYEGAFASPTFNGEFVLEGTLEYVDEYAFAGGPNLYGEVYMSQIYYFTGEPFYGTNVMFFDDTMYG